MDKLEIHSAMLLLDFESGKANLSESIAKFVHLLETQYLSHKW